MAREKFLTHRGDITGVAGVGDTLLFVTVHPEKQATALYRLDAEKGNLQADPLPCGGAALVADKEEAYLAGTDGKIYHASPGKAHSAKARGQVLVEGSHATALALLADNLLGAIVGKQLLILARKDAKILQTLELPDDGTCLAVDPTGRWIAAGTIQGNIAVFEGTDGADYRLSEQSRLHEGAVTALLFEAGELRFFSAGRDNKLLTTYARGKLEPEDKGRGNNHEDIITSLILGPGDRFYSGSHDKTIKNWPRGSFIKPSTLKDEVVKVNALGLVAVGKKQQLAVACADSSVRLFALDDEGTIGEQLLLCRDAYALARSELESGDPDRRESALKTLASYDDTPALDMVAERMLQDGDHRLRLLAAELLGKTDHQRAAKKLEEGLAHNDEAVRLAAFKGLRKHHGDRELHPIDLALKVGQPDVGVAAVQALEKLAKEDDQALARLEHALNLKTPEVRETALLALEKAFETKSPRANLIALNSKHADIRRLALLRLQQRGLVQEPAVQAALRWRGEDGDSEVRRASFLISLYTRPNLLKALRERDPELERQLVELEKETVGEKKKEKGDRGEKKEEKPAKAPALPRPGTPVKLDATSYDPLLQATASRALDTCLRGARGLAVLGDGRAFGLLLQLSREDDVTARVEVCRALAALDDARSIKRLRSLLYDKEASVRDAAFTALLHIHDEKPLDAAEAGLGSANEDVRRRGLQVLIEQCKKARPKTDGEPTWTLLVRALNDSFPGVRSEAFKAALNLKVGGGGVQTYRFILQSVHADVRREVLTEVMAQFGEDWAWALLLEFFNDPDSSLRSEAFEFATRKSKELAPLEQALLSRHADTRLLAVAGLAKKHSKAAQAVLLRALADKDQAVRRSAVASLIDDDAVSALEEALTAAHPDIRVRAAGGLARYGNKTALSPLLTIASTPEPQQQERVADWQELVRLALEGLAQLGDPAALTDLLPHLNSKHADLRRAAAVALMWCSRPGSLDALRGVLQHSDPQVKYHAALGLAFNADPLASALVFSQEGRAVLTPHEQLGAALTLGSAGEDQLIVFLDHENEHIRNQALLLLMLLEMKDNQGTPSRCLAALSSRMPRVRLTAAGALENFSNPESLDRYVVTLVNDRGDEQAWKITPEVVDDLAELIAHAEPLLRARTAALLEHFAPKEQSAWNQHWAQHSKRFATEIKARRQQAKGPPVQSKYDLPQLQELAFGAYVGLVREQGGAHDDPQRAAPGSAIARIRQTALSRILALAQASTRYNEAGRPVLIQALGDPNQPVRMQAFEQLKSLGMDATALGSEALEAGHLDLGVKGLELLSAGASSAQGQSVLRQVMLSRNDELAVEAAKLLMAPIGKVAVAGECLEAVNEELRKQAVHWLAEEYEKEAKAKELLRGALESRFKKVRNNAALELAGKKDKSAFDALIDLLKRQEEADKQKRVIKALVHLGDKRAPDAFIDRVLNDPAGTAVLEDLLEAAGRYRRPETVDRLLELAVNNPKCRKEAFKAVRVISGFDQNIEDPEDERPDKSWEEKQHQRRPAILAKMLEKAFNIGDLQTIKYLVPQARFARGSEVDPILGLLVNLTDEGIRQGVAEAIGFRVRKRNAPAEPLIKCLNHRDPLTQFIAAEGLAKAGRREGMGVLLASIDFQSDLRLRQRAVQALGILGDNRALEVLLKLANEEGHALQDAAAEALGHLGRSEKGDDIFKLLERFAKRTTTVAANALKGLRWLNTRAGWNVIRQRAEDTAFPYQSIAVDLLGYNDDPATRDLLLKMLSRGADYTTRNQGVTAARRLFGPDSLEPDYAIVQNPHWQIHSNPLAESLKRVCEKGEAEAERMLEILPSCKPEVQEQLAISILQHEPAPLDQARAGLGSEDDRTVQLAAQILGRAGSGAGDCSKPLEKALGKWETEWTNRRAAQLRQNSRDFSSITRASNCLQTLLWCAGRLQTAATGVTEATSVHSEDPQYRTVRLAALSALAEWEKPTPAALKLLQAAATGPDQEARLLATDALARVEKKKVNALGEQLLSDRVTLNRIADQPGIELDDTLRKAADQLHYQGVALPYLIAHQELDTLTSVADNRKLPEAVRLGAIEGLALLADERAEAKLVELGQAEKEDEDIRKAAWRGLRRSRRRRKALVSGKP